MIKKYGTIYLSIVLLGSTLPLNCYIYTVYNMTGKDLWIEANISGQKDKRFIVNGQSADMGFSSGWKKGLCLTEFKYKHQQAPQDTKNTKDWKLVPFSLGKDLAGAVGGGTAAGGAVAGAIGGAVGGISGATVGMGTIEIAGIGSLYSSAVFAAVGVAAGAALGIAIVGGGLALGALCRNITGNGGIVIYANKQEKIRWTFAKLNPKKE